MNNKTKKKSCKKRATRKIHKGSGRWRQGKRWLHNKGRALLKTLVPHRHRRSPSRRSPSRRSPSRRSPSRRRSSSPRRSPSPRRCPSPIGPGAQFRLKRKTIKQLSQIPQLDQDITEEIQKHFTANTIKKYRKKRSIKREQLKRRFELYNQRTGESYDPMDPELAELTKFAAKLLTRNDYRSRFWKDVIGNIYIGLNENQWAGGPGAEFYNKVERNFGILLAKMMDYDIYAGDYLRDDVLYQTLVVPILGIND